MSTSFNSLVPVLNAPTDLFYKIEKQPKSYRLNVDSGDMSSDVSVTCPGHMSEHVKHATRHQSEVSVLQRRDHVFLLVYDIPILLAPCPLPIDMLIPKQ